MNTSAALIRKFYRVNITDRLAKVIDQVEAVTGMLDELLEADFAGVFYCKHQGESLVPVAYHDRLSRQVQLIDQLERSWSAEELCAMHPVNNKVEMLRFAPEESLDVDVFARANEFNFRYLLPYHLDGRLQGGMIAYWSADPGELNEHVIHLANQLMQVLFGSMSLADEMTDVENYSVRLSDLTAMFEMSIGDLSFREVVTEIITRFRSVVPHAGICVLAEDRLTGKYKVGEHLDEVPPTPAAVGNMLDAVERLVVGRRSEPGARPVWIDLSERLANDYGGAFAIKMTPDDEHRFVLAVWTRRANGFEQNDLELLPVFSLFADMVLQNALLVKSLRKVNYLLKKSSSRLANIESLAALADMTSGVAHDFNNIVGGIIGRLQLMKLRARDQSIIPDLDKIESMAMEGAETVRRLQEYATSARQKEHEPVNLNGILEECLNNRSAEWQELALRGNVRVEVRMLEDKAMVMGCRPDLVIALEKLVTNAVEISPQGGRVEVVLSGDERRFTVSVVDQGPGISDEIAKKIYYPFFSTKHHRGAGLGLAIVHGIVSRHDGRIDFRNGAKGGVTFSMSFNRTDKDEEISDITRRVRIPVKLRILVVDDDEQIREVLRDMLTIDGHSPTTCADGYQALKKLEEGKFDIMITDLGMPGMSGLDLAGVVHEAHPEMPIAMITGWGTQLSRDETALKGIKTVLSKPFHLKDVKALVQDLSAS